MGQGFLRRETSRFSKLGKRRKKLQRWKKPTGRDNKMREKRKGYPKTVSIGYSVSRKTRGKINEKTPVMVMNLVDLEKINENEIAIIGNIGKKKRLEIAKKAKELKISLHNMNPKTFIKKNEPQKKETKSKENKK